MFNYFLVFYLLGIMSFFFNQFSLLMCLISLEFMFLCIYSLMSIYMNINFDFYLLVLYLFIGVMEGVIGLMILFSVVRIYGNDYLLNKSILQC